MGCPFHAERVEDYNPLQPETFESAHAEYARMRAECPVAHSDAYGGFWALARYGDIVDVLSTPQRYITSVQNVVPAVAFTGRRPPLHFDPPQHTPYRAVLNPLLSSEAVARMEPIIRAYVDEELAPLLQAGTCAGVCPLDASARRSGGRVAGAWPGVYPGGGVGRCRCNACDQPGAV